MINQTRNSRHFAAVGAAIVGLSLLAVSGEAYGADEPAEAFYAENTELTIAGGHDAGSGFDFYMRTVAAAVARVSDLEASVRNIPGAGGLIGDNDVFEATPDGTTIGLLNFPGHVFAELTGAPGVRFDFSKWEYLGRVAAGPPVILVAADSPFQTVDDLVASTEPIRFAIEEAGSDAFYGAVVSAKAFGFSATNITGYEGTSDILAAIMRGEADATFLSYGSSMESIRNGETRALMIFADAPVEALPDVPLASTFVDTQEAKDTVSAFGHIYNLERVFVAPPGTPADRVAFLRNLLMMAFEDPTLLEEIKQAGRPVNPMSGEEVAKAVEDVARQADQIRKILE